MQRFLNSWGFSQQCLLEILPLLLLVLLTSGCVTSSADSAGRTRNLATTAATTAGGAYIGANNSNDRAKGAAIGAAAGFVFGEAVNYFNDKAQREAFLSGYEKGQSDAVKQQYWIARDNQRPKADAGCEETYYEIDVPQSDRDGVRRESTKRVIRVVIPKEES